MNQEMKRLGNAELEIMLVLWSAKGPLTSNDVRVKLKEKRDWKLSTLMSAMEKLAKLGYIHVDRETRTNYYSAIVTESEYKVFEGKSLLEKLYGSSLKNLVASFYQEDEITPKELADLEAFIGKIKEREMK